MVALGGTDYRLHLVVAGESAGKLPEVGSPVMGRIRARARRVDVTFAGGRFIEPVNGRPRRVQGRVMATDGGTNSITVQAAPGCALVCTLTDGRQKPGDFKPGQLVGFEVEKGAALEVVR